MTRRADMQDADVLRVERTEAALRLSEATKTAILQTALDCIITIDHSGFVLDWNPAAERTFGYSLAEAVGREMAELIIPPRLRELHRRGLARAVETGRDVLEGQRLEISALRRNGEEFPVELSITRIGGGPTPLFTGHIRDITDRKSAERELRENQQLLSSVTRNISEAIFRRSLGEGLVFVNDAYVKMFGYSGAEELRQVPAEQLYADPGRRADLVSRLKTQGAIRNEEVEYRRKDGSTFWGLTSATGIYDESSRAVLYFDGAIHDITERKQDEQRRAAQYAVVRALAESSTLEEAAPGILEAVCIGLGWDVGTIWQVSPPADGTPPHRAGKATSTPPSPDTLRCVEVWHQPGLMLQRFVDATRRTMLGRGIGLPGRIWKTVSSVWISDVLKDGNFPRGPIAAVCGLHGAFAFPIFLGRQVSGVVEFFSRRIREPDARLLEMFSAIGSQIGQFIERKRVEAEVRHLNQDLERRVAARTQELTEAVRALRESEDRYRTVAEHTPAAVVVLDVDAGRFVEVNENAVGLFGRSRDALLKLGPAQLSPKLQPGGRLSTEAARDQIEKALEGSTPVFEWVHSRADGTEIPCEVRVARMPAAGRELVVGAITDITGRKAAEAELRAALQQEKELNQLKSNFVSVVSHEFRTPLGVILSAADILDHYFDRLTPAQRAGHLEDIRYATQQMTGLMEEVLLLGRVEAGRMELKPEPLDLKSFCARVVEEQCSATGGKCPVELKLQPFGATARGDEAILRHIFGNLLSNAIKYSAAGTPVRFSAGRDGTETVFEIVDEGIGIPPEDQKRLFEAFHRAQNVGEIPGTGLGLVIVKRCLELHAGTIQIESTVGRGTTVSVRLKLFPARASTRPLAASPKPSNRKTKRRRRR